MEVGRLLLTSKLLHYCSSLFIMALVTFKDKQRYGTSSDRLNSFDDSLEIEKITPILQRDFPDCEIVDKPYGPYDIDLVVRRNGKDILWVDLERNFRWVGEYDFDHVSFLERKFHFIEEAKRVGANFTMCWFNRNHTEFVLAHGEVIERYESFDKTLRSGRVDRVRHINLSDVIFRNS